VNIELSAINKNYIAMETRAKQNDENKVRLLYKKLLGSWNNHSAGDFANLFAGNGNSIGFDGSQMNGRKQINDEINQIFVYHKVSSFVGIIREIRSLSPTVFILRAVAGMVLPGQSEINPAVNAIQTLIAQKEQEQFCIALFHNTPAAFHGRPELSWQLTEELQQVLKQQNIQ
jgi:uncharacterized protein (TIGR02246 family)